MFALLKAAVLLIGLFASTASAQRLASAEPRRALGPPQLTVDALALEALDLGPAVKGAPFSAEATTTFIQTLPDGNRIVRRTNASLYRDSRGRTRREVTLEGMAGIIAGGAPLRIVTISDPESGMTYVLDSNQQLRVLRNAPDQSRTTGTAPPGFPTRTIGPAPPGLPAGFGAGVAPQQTPGVAREETLRGREIAGVACEGTRTTVTIPAGAIGNERPIESVTERWFSPALQIVVMSRRDDPRFGETTYQLTKVTRDEPPAALFEKPER